MTGDSRGHILFTCREAQALAALTNRDGSGVEPEPPCGTQPAGSEIAAIRPYLGVNGLYGRDPVNFMADVQGLPMFKGCSSARVRPSDGLIEKAIPDRHSSNEHLLSSQTPAILDSY